MTKRKATSIDIARQAGVSQATVSYVLNNTPGKSISEGTKKRVLKAAADLNYTPNSAARRLKTSRANCVAVRFAANLSLTRYHSILQGIRSYLEPAGYSILLCADINRSKGSPDFIKACLSTQADGVIYVCSGSPCVPTDTLEQIEKHRIPMVTLDNLSDDLPLSNVGYDYFASSYLRADRLIRAGFRKFIYVRPDYENPKEELRERGMKAAVYSGENMEMDIRKVPINDGTAKSIALDPLTYDVEKGTLHRIKKLVCEAPADSCFVCNSRELQNLVSIYLHQQFLLNPDTRQIPWHTRSISYHFPHFDAGYEAARSLLDIFDGKKDLRKLVFQPVLDTTDPEMF